MAEEWHALSEWVLGLAHRYGSRVTVRLVDVASMEGFFKSLFRRLHRYPAFVVEGTKYVGSDFSKVDALISECLTAQRVGS
ncbi:MAG: hypothetical protein HY725_12975 [Candidatus Rokubacteria bacterium]|nr:hypothetical protein [Candidatus Rokubacteria bacterium]